MSGTTTYNVVGMTCGGCAKGLAGALRGAGIDAEVDFRAGTATVAGSTPADAVRAAVEGAGFEYAGVEASGASHPSPTDQIDRQSLPDRK